MGVEISGSPCTISDVGFVLFLPQDPIPLTTLAKRLESISNVHGIVTEPPFPKIYRGKSSFTFTIVARKTRCHSNLVAIHYLPLSLTPFTQPTNGPVETLDGATLLRLPCREPTHQRLYQVSRIDFDGTSSVDKERWRCFCHIELSFRI